MLEVAGRGGGEAADYASLELYRETKVRPYPAIIHIQPPI